MRRFTSDLTSLRESRQEQLTSLKTWALDLAARRQRSTELAPALQRATRDLRESEERLARASGEVERQREQVRALSLELETAQVRLEAAQRTDSEMPSARATRCHLCRSDR